ncbi:nicotinamide riboside transporter PnuC [Paraglaciecola sp. 2405UD69-4]|uniref:nicotinamide riboside transporter PnuC n=1 Tax=Paraglaciecola sp. 2405UD69-4 TaxID=3391836 RepID=UPI0039C9A8E6
MDSFIAQLTATSFLEGVAVILALAYVWLAALQNVWCWPCALVSTALYTWLFWSVSLPFHTLLNIYFMLMAVYGWLKWTGSKEQSITVKTLPIFYHLLFISGLSLAAIGLSYYASSIFDSSYLYLDAFITVFSVFTTFLVTHKVRENWLYWIVINIFGVYLYFSKGMSLTGVLYLFYVGFAVYGYLKWRGDSAINSDNIAAT